MKLIIKICFLLILIYVNNSKCALTEFKTKTLAKTSSKTKTSSQTKTSTLEGLSFRDKLSFLNPHFSDPNLKVKYDTKNKPDEIDDSGIIFKLSKNRWEGWVKYFKINKGQKPKTFFKNYYYQKQMKENPNLDLTKMKDGRFLYIRNENLFFISLNENNISIANSRINPYNSNYDTIFIDFIAPVEEGQTYSGGIQDFGSFSEGFCFKVITTKDKLLTNLTPDVFTTEFVFCCGSKTEKEEFMTTLKSLKLNNQKKDGLVIIPHNKEYDQKDNKNYLDNYLGNKQNYKTEGINGTVIHVQNGRWIILQNWSQCSLKCGGGKSTLHRFCIPPIGGGLPCEGESIIHKDCNTQPCKLVKI
jgi:hypothetical protein